MLQVIVLTFKKCSNMKQAAITSDIISTFLADNQLTTNIYWPFCCTVHASIFIHCYDSVWSECKQIYTGFFYCLFISVLPFEINLSRGRKLIDAIITGINQHIFVSVPTQYWISIRCCVLDLYQVLWCFLCCERYLFVLLTCWPFFS
jgi:hypothetical protein